MQANQIKFSPEFQAEQDYKEFGEFMNPYPVGSNDWMDYEASKLRVQEREAKSLDGEL